jgi:acyl carrier protein
VELGEIEQVLSGVEGVEQCVVVAREEPGGQKRLVGYVVGRGVFDREAVMSALRRRLPEYMIPTAWVQLEKFPVTSNGKVNRKALPSPEGMGRESGEYVAPRNEMESRLAEIWQDILHIDRVGISQNFFELGGHSLLVMRLIAAIKNEFMVNVPVKFIVQLADISMLSEFIQLKTDNKQDGLMEYEIVEI